MEDAAIQYKENFTYNLAIDTAVGIGEKFVDVKRTKSIEKNKAMEGEKRKVGKLSTKEKTVRKITSKNEGYSQNQAFLNGEKSTRNAQGSISPTCIRMEVVLMSEVIIFKMKVEGQCLSKMSRQEARK